MVENKTTYETVCLTKLAMPGDQFQKLIDQCTQIIEKDGKGKILLQDDWGKAKISYPIEKEERAQWTYLRFETDSKVLPEFRRQFKINEFVLRQITFKADPEGNDYNTLRAQMPKELDERDKKKEWKDDRKFRRGGRPDRGPRHGGGYEARSSAPTGDRAPEGAAGTTAPAAPAADSSAKPSSEGPSS